MGINNKRYLDWIERCNQHDKNAFMPFIVDDVIVGYIHQSNLKTIEPYTQYLSIIKNQSLQFTDNYNNNATRSKAMKAIVDDLFQRGIFKCLVGEDYDVMEAFGDPILFQMERAATTFFGIHKYGIHINGYVIKNNEYYMWVATRAIAKPMWPGKLDHIVAGGHSSGHTIEETMRKECAEEASITEDLLKNSIPVSYLNYQMEKNQQLSRDALFIYDIVLPESFVPVNTDGEVDDFRLMPIQEVLEIVNNTDNYKINCNLVIIDFAIRHGFIKPDEDYYTQIVKGLRV